MEIIVRCSAVWVLCSYMYNIWCSGTRSKFTNSLKIQQNCEFTKCTEKPCFTVSLWLSFVDCRHPNGSKLRYKCSRACAERLLLQQLWFCLLNVSKHTHSWCIKFFNISLHEKNAVAWYLDFGPFYLSSPLVREPRILGMVHLKTVMRLDFSLQLHFYFHWHKFVGKLELGKFLNIS
jgi:hypothetical protein